jgi:hypothetical protein
MRGFDDLERYSPQVRTLQIVTGALIAGPIMFSLFTMGLGAWNKNGDPDILNWVAIGLSIVVAIISYFLPNTIRPSMLSDQLSPDMDARAQSLALYQTRMIVRYAPIEGAAFFNLVAFLVTGARLSLGVAALLIAVMISIFPTRARITHFLETEEWNAG